MIRQDLTTTDRRHGDGEELAPIVAYRCRICEHEWRHDEYRNPLERAHHHAIDVHGGDLSTTVIVRRTDA